jgi:hypothetical protein
VRIKIAGERRARREEMEQSFLIRYWRKSINKIGREPEKSRFLEKWRNIANEGNN